MSHCWRVLPSHTEHLPCHAALQKRPSHLPCKPQDMLLGWHQGWQLDLCFKAFIGAVASHCIGIKQTGNALWSDVYLYSLAASASVVYAGCATDLTGQCTPCQVHTISKHAPCSNTVSQSLPLSPRRPSDWRMSEYRAENGQGKSIVNWICTSTSRLAPLLHCQMGSGCTGSWLAAGRYTPWRRIADSQT